MLEIFPVWLLAAVLLLLVFVFYSGRVVQWAIAAMIGTLAGMIFGLALGLLVLACSGKLLIKNDEARVQAARLQFDIILWSCTALGGVLGIARAVKDEKNIA